MGSLEATRPHEMFGTERGVLHVRVNSDLELELDCEFEAQVEFRVLTPLCRFSFAKRSMNDFGTCHLSPVRPWHVRQFRRNRHETM